MVTSCGLRAAVQQFIGLLELLGFIGFVEFIESFGSISFIVLSCLLLARSRLAIEIRLRVAGYELRVRNESE